MGHLYFLGYIYNEVNANGEGEAIRERWAGTQGTVVCRVKDQPAILVDGKFYVQGKNINPGTAGIWDRLKKRRA